MDYVADTVVVVQSAYHTSGFVVYLSFRPLDLLSVSHMDFNHRLILKLLDQLLEFALLQ